MRSCQCDQSPSKVSVTHVLFLPLALLDVSQDATDVLLVTDSLLSVTMSI